MSSRVTTSSSTTTNIPQENIAKRAYEKWCKRGRPHGTDKQDWIEAEAELCAEAARAGQSGAQGTQSTQGSQAPRMPAAGGMRR